MDTRKEEWRSICGYEKYYEVSSLGRVRSLDRVVNSNGGKRLIRGRIIKTRPNKQGYNIVTLTVNRKAKTLRVARLVAAAFIPNPHNLPQVNHIDETRNNDVVSNLEWCSIDYNLRYGNRLAKIDSKQKRKPVEMLRNGEVVKRFMSVHEAARFLGNDRWQGNISACARGVRKQAYGYNWRYVS